MAQDNTTKREYAGPREKGNGKVCSVKEQKQAAGGICGSVPVLGLWSQTCTRQEELPDTS